MKYLDTSRCLCQSKEKKPQKTCESFESCLLCNLESKNNVYSTRTYFV